MKRGPLARHWDDDSAMADEAIDWMGEQTASPEFAQKFEADWDPDKHPRVPAGSEGGGEFTHAGGDDGGISPPAPKGTSWVEIGDSLRGGQQILTTPDGKAVIDHARSLEQKLGPKADSVHETDFRYALGHLREDMDDSKLATEWKGIFDRYGENKVGLALAAARGYEGSLTPRSAAQMLDAAQKIADEKPSLEAPDTGGLEGGRATAQLAFALENNLKAEDFVRYAGAADSYSSTEYREMNAYLREPGRDEPRVLPYSDTYHAPDEFQSFNKDFDQLLSSAPDIEGPHTFYRGFRLPEDSPFAKAFIAGSSPKPFVEKGFMSASTSKAVAYDWAEAKVNQPPHLGDPRKETFLLTWKNEGGAKNVTPFLNLGKTEGEINYRPGAKIWVTGSKRVSTARGDMWLLTGRVKGGPGLTRKKKS